MKNQILVMAVALILVQVSNAKRKMENVPQEGINAILEVSCYEPKPEAKINGLAITSPEKMNRLKFQMPIWHEKGQEVFANLRLDKQDVMGKTFEGIEFKIGTLLKSTQVLAKEMRDSKDHRYDCSEGSGGGPSHYTVESPIVLDPEVIVEVRAAKTKKLCEKENIMSLRGFRHFERKGEIKISKGELNLSHDAKADDFPKTRCMTLKTASTGVLTTLAMPILLPIAILKGH